MEIKAIGKYGRFAPSGECTNAYLFITKGNRKFMIDFGAGALSRLQNYIDVTSLDAVILTHLHHDHISDIGTLGYCLGYKGANALKVYAPIMPDNAVGILKSNAFENIVLDKDTRLNIDNVDITFLPSIHPVETYAVRMAIGGITLVYTSDISDKVRLMENVADADIVIGDACILAKDYKVGAPHVCVRDLALAVPNNAKLYLAHLDKELEKDILAEAIAVHKNTELIRDFEITE